jgi:hypothetical protein
MAETKAPNAPPAGKTITVEVSLRSGRLHIDKDQTVVRMKLNDRIRWESKTEFDFWIVFEDRTPFERHALEAPNAADLRRPLLHGAFKYSIVLHSNRLVRLDPVVVVDPPPEDPYVRTGGG